MVDIYGTLGPSCHSQEVLMEMFCSGMTGIRLNLSHISLRESERQLDIFNAAALHAGVEPLLLIDMQGPELRIGRLQAPLMLSEDQTAVLFDEEMGETRDCPSAGRAVRLFPFRKWFMTPWRSAERSSWTTDVFSSGLQRYPAAASGQGSCAAGCCRGERASKWSGWISIRLP